MSNSDLLLAWKKPVIQAKFLRRYKRFFADVELPTGETVIAHVANSGSMKSCHLPDQPCLVMFHDDPARKLKYSLEAIASNDGWIGVNTSYPNMLAEVAFTSSVFQHWHPFKNWAREVKISDHSRTDLVLWDEATSPGLVGLQKPSLAQIRSAAGPRFHFVEVKNVTYAEGARALFPDSVTERGLKHVNELVELLELGHTAEFLFIIQRNDVDHFAPAHAIDPQYSKALIAAQKKGLIISPFVMQLSLQGFHLRSLPLPFQAQ